MNIRPVIMGRVTVITAVFNAASLLPRCIESVQSQDYPDIEHIVMDGGSTDGTIDVLQQMGNQLTFWKSEADRGIYDAWNKGLQHASGEWIAFLGADDCYLPGAVSSYINMLQGQNVQYVSSRMRWTLPSGKFRILGEPWAWPRFQRFMTTAHPGSLHHYSLFRDFGQYDISYRSAADYEMLLRPRASLRTLFLPIVTVEMMSGGTSDSSKALVEQERAKASTGHRNKYLCKLERYYAQFKLFLRNLLIQFGLLGAK